MFGSCFIEESNSSVNPRQPRCKLQFGLRSLLVGVTVCAVLLALWRCLVLAGRPYDLIQAAERGGLAEVGQLLAQGTNVDSRDAGGTTDFMYAASKRLAAETTSMF